MPKTTIIAEIGINWAGRIGVARNLIWLAKEAGADVAKFQLYRPSKLWPDHKLIVDGRNWYPEVSEAELTFDQAAELAEYCDAMGIEFMASVFDLERFNWLEEIKVKRYKVGNRYKDPAVIEAMAKTGKEVLISHTPGEPFELPADSYQNFHRLYCISKYPTKLTDFHFNDIDFGGEWGQYYGASLHYPGAEPALFAITKGAQIIEVHFAGSRRIVYNPDITSSLTTDELKYLVQATRMIERMR